MSRIEDFVARLDEARIVAAIRAAELATSGEIKVHVEESAGTDIEGAALERFRALGLEATSARNGVLIFIAARERRFHILADAGIHALVEPSCWQDIAAAMARDFALQRFTEGLADAIAAIAERLQAYFPHLGLTDANEISNAISRGAAERVAIGLGANLGNPRVALARAADALARWIEIERISSLYESEPLATRPGQPWFTNAAITGTTLRPPEALLAEAKRLEFESGRDPHDWHGPRQLDIDLLIYGSRVVPAGGLQLPHPGLLERRFVLEPLVEIAGAWIHPTTGRTLAAELAARSLSGKLRKLGPWLAR